MIRPIDFTPDSLEAREKLEYGKNYLALYDDLDTEKMAFARCDGNNFEFCRERFWHEDDEPKFYEKVLGSKMIITGYFMIEKYGEAE